MKHGSTKTWDRKMRRALADAGAARWRIEECVPEDPWWLPRALLNHDDRAPTRGALGMQKVHDGLSLLSNSPRS